MVGGNYIWRRLARLLLKDIIKLQPNTKRLNTQRCSAYHELRHDPYTLEFKHAFNYTGSLNRKRSEIARALTKSYARHFSSSSPTIYSLSSGHGKCGVAVVRVSGSLSADVLNAMCRNGNVQPRKAVLSRIYDPETREMLDRGIVLWFPAPHSFTGEDCCEFHVHGGPAVVQAVLRALDKIPTLRQAEAGEFTKRAFQNGKLDLTEVEGLGDLIHAETEEQRKQALRQMEGDLGKLYTGWRKDLLKCVADVEAYIDFSEDDNIEDNVLEEVETRVKTLITSIDRHLKDNRQGERLRDGVHVAIIGKPNVGKSSLLNLITQRPAAIVSPIAGTTRDVVETAVNIGGYPVLLSDTAGLRDTDDQVELEGVRRALQRGEQADLQVVVLNASELDKNGVLKELGQSLNTCIDNHMTHLGFTSSHKNREKIIVLNKSDQLKDGCHIEDQPGALCQLSCLTEEGVDSFMQVLADKVKSSCANPSSGSPSLTQGRHRMCLDKCLTSLHEYMAMHSSDIVIGAHELRKALRQLGKVTGKITSEEILDVIFKDFCIGK